MNNNFLKQYTIPTLIRMKIGLESKEEIYQKDTQTLDTNTSIGVSNYSRYFPTERQYDKSSVAKVKQTSPLKRSHNHVLSVESSEAKIKIFTGRDSSYPDDLNMLINPFSCELCKVQLNSQITASYHYASKTHDRKITAWLAEHYPDHPPPIKRLFKENPKGEKTLRCEQCDLPLTSTAHATQHYAGRRHNLVANKKSDPSGAGYYNSEGKWIRTGTKKFSSKNIDSRFGIGEDFVQSSDASIPQESNEQKISSTVMSPKSELPVDDSLCCKVCNIFVTSTTQMAMHVTGAKHKKKLALSDSAMDKELGIITTGETTEANTNSIQIIINNDETEHLSMYRTPTGFYYCQFCDSTMNHVTILQQHIQGKRHKMKVKISNLSKEHNDLEST